MVIKGLARGNPGAPRASNDQESHGNSDTEPAVDPVDERAIIARCVAGERTAYATLVERYQGLVHDLVSRMIGDAVEAEDIAQDAFVKAYLSLKRFRGESRFSTWLCRIALNRCKDVLRRRSREPWIHAAADADSGIADLLDDEPTPVFSLERRQREGALHRALARLPVKYREAVVLRHFEGLGFREIGRVLGISEGAAKVRTFRGREMLRALLAEQGLSHDAV